MYVTWWLCDSGLWPISACEFLLDHVSKLDDVANDLLADLLGRGNLVFLDRRFESLTELKDLRRIHVGDSTFQAMCRVE